MLDAQPTTVYPASPDDPSRNLKFVILVRTSLHLFPGHCFVDHCRRWDEIWPDMSTKKSVLYDSTNYNHPQENTKQTFPGLPHCEPLKLFYEHKLFETWWNCSVPLTFDFISFYFWLIVQLFLNRVFFFFTMELLFYFICLITILYRIWQ